MKDKILLVYTGGTICSFLTDHVKKLNVGLAKSVIVDNYEKSDSKYALCAKDLFEDSHLSISVLSENLTVEKQNCIIENIKSFDLNNYAGVIVLHGTDTLAYTASLFSVVFCNTPVPIMLVSANKPLGDPETNANDNFRYAVEHIMGGIAPNVYVPYRNSDGIMYLHIASTIMQCANFSEDFYNASPSRVFSMSDDVFDCCKALSGNRLSVRDSENKINRDVSSLKELNDLSVLLIHPYVGLDYSRIDLTGIKMIVHGTYHSGTVCVERNDPEAKYGTKSVLYLADICRDANIPIYMAPCLLDSGQYSSIYDAAQNGGVVPVNMTVEAAYAKAIVGVSCGYTENELREYMLTDIAGEIIE